MIYSLPEDMENANAHNCIKYCYVIIIQGGSCGGDI